MADEPTTGGQLARIAVQLAVKSAAILSREANSVSTTAGTLPAIWPSESLVVVVVVVVVVATSAAVAVLFLSLFSILRDGMTSQRTSNASTFKTDRTVEFHWPCYRKN